MPNATYVNKPKSPKAKKNDPVVEEPAEDINTSELVKPSKTELLKELAELKKEQEESHDKLLRAYAEIENIRRRTRQDVEKAHKYGIESFVKALLPVVDSLGQALEHNQAAEGVELTLKMLLNILDKSGVKVVNPLHEPFDPQLHEAMTMQENSEVEPNTVLQVFQKGYTLHGRLIRPAMVIVSKA